MIKAFIQRLAPEGVRAVVLDPDRYGNTRTYVPGLMKALQSVPNCEVVSVDATSRDAHGMEYAAYFYDGI
ncbi:MAG: hypothetical protein OXH11_06750 [Candidatus Aminicenantes bacterium]|nr:hypothetical protein [Candidatus Aminicenantes bacterium]